MGHIFMLIILLSLVNCALNCELCNIDSKEEKEVYKTEKLKDQIQVLDNGFQIFVQTLTGKTVALEAKITDSVESLKKQIWDKEGIPIGQQRLIYSGRQLEDGHALAEYDIPNGATLQLILSLRTGRRIKIFVDLQKKFTIFANESDTIEKLKDEILRYLHDLEMKTFVFDKLQNDAIGHLSSDDNTIADYGIRNLATLHVRDQSQDPPILSPKFITRHHVVHHPNRNRNVEVQNAVTLLHGGQTKQTKFVERIVRKGQDELLTKSGSGSPSNDAQKVTTFVRGEQINIPLPGQKLLTNNADAFAGKDQNGSSRKDAQNAPLLIQGDQSNLDAETIVRKDQNGILQKSDAGLSRKDAQNTTILGDITNMSLTEQNLDRAELSAEKDQNVSAPKSSIESSQDAQNAEILMRGAQTNLPLTGQKASLDNAKSFVGKDQNGLLQKSSSGLPRKDAQILGDKTNMSLKGQTKGAKHNQNGPLKKVANVGAKKNAKGLQKTTMAAGKSQMGKTGTGIRKAAKNPAAGKNPRG